jgi:hypothetical protein
MTLLAGCSVWVGLHTALLVLRMTKFLARDQNGFLQSLDVWGGLRVRGSEYFIIHKVVAALLD